MIPDYNRIAPYYDKLARLVFGDRLERAQKTHLNMIDANSSVLIVGGGTGAILEYLEERNIRLDVDFVELSSGMIEEARNRNYKLVRPTYYQMDIMNFKGSNYDYILINFFFDQYNFQEAKNILNRLEIALSEDGAILFVDFIRSDKLVDKILLRLMYLFFHFSANLNKVELIEYNDLFSGSNLRSIKSTAIGSNIKAEVYLRL